MKQFLRITGALFIFLFCVQQNFAQCDWESVGLDNDQFFIADGSSSFKPAIAADNAGVVYVVYSDALNSGKASVKRYVNGYWSLMGNAGFSDGNVDYVRIAIDNLNRVYVAYQDYANGKKITVMYFNGVSWVSAGSPGFSPVKVNDLDLAIDLTSNKPYVTFADSTAKISVMNFNGVSWSTVGSTGFSFGITGLPVIAVTGNTPYVAYADHGKSGQVYVMKYNGTTWDSVGNLWMTGYGALNIELDNFNVPHIVFADTASGKASVAYYNGSSWQYLGAPNISSGSPFYPEMDFDASNNLFLAYSWFGTPERGELAKYNGGSWSVLGQLYGGSSSPYGRFWGIAVNSATAEPFMLYSQNNSQPLSGLKDWGVVKWNGTGFENTNGKSITGVVSYNTNGYTANFNVDPFGVPYVSYTDSVNGQKASVKKFNGTNWVQVGPPAFSNGTTEFNSIAFDTSGVPYVSFRENGNSPSVMMYNGASWVYVGASMFYTAGVGAFTSLAIHPLTNEPYIFFDDASQSFKGTCMRYDGANWVNVGNYGFTAGGVFGNTTLKFNPAGTPYIAYPDGSVSSKLMMMKYNGSSWVNVGTNPLSAGLVADHGFDFDAGGNIYLAYADGGQSYKVTAKTFNGTSWTAMGTFLNSSYAGGCDLAVDPSGNVFVYYTDQYLNYYPGTVKRYFNNAWVTVGRPQIFNGVTSTNSIHINPVTGLPVIGSLLNGNYGEGRGYYVKTLPCNFNTAVGGQVYYDVNSDCAQTSGENVLSNMPVVLSQGSSNAVAFTDNTGSYYFTAIPVGTYTVGMGNLSSGYNVQCANSQPHSTVVAANALSTENFAIACTPQFDFVAGSATPIGFWWPGQQVTLVAHAWVNKTVCTGTPTPGTIKLAFPPCLKYVADTSLLLQPDSVQVLVTGDTITYNVSDVYNYPAAFFNNLITRAQVCTTAVSGDTLCIQLIVSAMNDANSANDVYTRCIAVAASYDPNNKEVTPTGSGSAGIIPGNTSELQYTINFQNTGTAPAVNIVIKDTISPNFDISTLEILASSHLMSGTSVNDNIVSFNFPNIMLPDSGTDELNSHGFVTFKLKLNYGLAPLTQIRNTGYIYFDYNPPVITNTTVNTLDLTAGIENENSLAALAMYPNPAKSEVFFSRPVQRVDLYDVRGAMIGKWNSCTKISLQDLAEGIYFVRAVEASGKVQTFKLLKTK
jgi:hypothetical protein